MIKPVPLRLITPTGWKGYSSASVFPAFQGPRVRVRVSGSAGVPRDSLDVPEDLPTEVRRQGDPWPWELS